MRQDVFSISGKAGWIGYDWEVDAGAALNSYFCYRKDFLFTKESKAKLLITADARYVAWINGKYVGRGPRRSFPREYRYDAWDVAEFCHEGVNSLAVLVHQFGVSNGQHQYRGRTGLLAQIESGNIVIGSDVTWLVRRADWYLPHIFRTSVHMGFQEHCNLGAEPNDWRVLPEDELQTDQSWIHPFFVGLPGCAPWVELVENTLEKFPEPTLQPKLIAKYHLPQKIAHWDELGNPIAVWSRIEEYIRQQGGKLVPAYEADSAGILVWDYGQHVAGCPVFTAKVMESGTQAIHFYGTGMDRYEMPMPNIGFGTANEGMADVTLLREGENRWESVMPRGFRYHITVFSGDSLSNAKSELRAVGSYSRSPLTFSTSNSVVNRLWNIGHATLCAGMLDAFVDNSHREQGQWLEDGTCAARAAFATFGCMDWWRELLLDFRFAQCENGILHCVAPSELNFARICDYTLFWIWNLYRYYYASGDRQTLERTSDCLTSLSDFIRSGIGKDGVFRLPPGSWVFLDWYPFEHDRPDILTLNLLVIVALRCAATLRKALGLESEARKLEAEAKALAENVQVKFRDPQKGVWLEYGCEGRLPEVDEEHPTGYNRDPWRCQVSPETPACSAHAHSLLLLLRMSEGKEGRKVARKIEEALLLPEDKISKPSPLWTDSIVASLFASGHKAEGIHTLLGLNAIFENMGVTQWPETWHAQKTRHAQSCGSALNETMSKCLLGIKPLSPGYGHVLFDPPYEVLEACSGEIKTPKGMIRVNWKALSDGLRAELDIPDGIVCHYHPRLNRKLISARGVIEPLVASEVAPWDAASALV